MMAVFASFIPASLRIVEELGLSMVGGILIDAVIIRTADTAGRGRPAYDAPTRWT